MFSSFAFLPGVGDMSFIYLYLGNNCNGRNGVFEAHPKLLWDSEQHLGFLLGAAEGNRARGARRGCAAGAKQQEQQQRGSPPGPPKGICGVGEGNFFFWLSHISAFLHRSWAGGQAASQPCEFPAHPPATSKTPSRQRMGRDDASWWWIRGHSAALRCSAQLREPELSSWGLCVEDGGIWVNI